MSSYRVKLEKEIRVLSVLLGLVILIILIMGAGIARKVIKTSGTRMFRRFITDSPISLISPVMNAEESKLFQKRLTEFSDALQDQTQSPELALNTRDLNYLISGTKGLQERFRIMEIDQERIVVLVSLSYFTGSKMRYLNGVAEIQPEFQAGYLRLSPASFNSGGKKFPKKLLWTFENVNLLSPLYYHRYTDTEQKRRIRSYFRQLRKIKLEKGQIVVS